MYIMNISAYSFLKGFFKDQRSPLHFAATHGSPNMVRLLLENGANVHDVDDVQYFYMTSAYMYLNYIRSKVKMRSIWP